VSWPLVIVFIVAGTVTIFWTLHLIWRLHGVWRIHRAGPRPLVVKSAAASEFWAKFLAAVKERATIASINYP